MDRCAARGGVPFVVLRAHQLILGHGSWDGRDTCVDMKTIEKQVAACCC